MVTRMPTAATSIASCENAYEVPHLDPADIGVACGHACHRRLENARVLLDRQTYGVIGF